jgi:phage shock protein PspC (stress-responsive transcriptional regulator)
MIAGVCGGLGRYFNVNPVFYRVGFVVLTLLGGAGLLIYGACLLVIPNDGEHESIASDVLRNHRQRPVALIGLALVAAAGIALLSHISFQFHSDVFWLVALLVGGSLLWAQRRTAATPAQTAQETSEPASAAALPAHRARRRGLWIGFGSLGALLLAAVVTALVFASIHAHLGDGVGNRAYSPASAASLRHDYRLGVGDMKVDLSRLPPGTARDTIHAHVGIGHLEIVVPEGTTVRVKAHVSWGEAKLLGHQEDGHDVRADVGPGDARLVLATDVGIGQVEVLRSVR